MSNPLQPALPSWSSRTGFGPGDRHGVYLVGSLRIAVGNAGIVYSRPGRDPFGMPTARLAGETDGAAPGFILDSNEPDNNAPAWVRRGFARWRRITSGDVPGDDEFNGYTDSYTYIEM